MSTSKNSKNPTKTVLLITVGFGIFYFLFNHDYLLYISLIVGLLGAISDFLAEKIDWIWMKIAWILSKIVPNIIMTLIYYFVLTPVALLSRLFGKRDPMDLKNKQNSFFKEKNQAYSKASFEKPW